MEFNKKNVKSIMFLIFWAVVLHFFVNNYSLFTKSLEGAITPIKPFIAGGIIALIVSVPMNALEKFIHKKFPKLNSKKKFVRCISMILTFLFIIGLTALIIFAVLPAFLDSTIDFANRFPNILNKFMEKLNSEENHFPYMEELKKETINAINRLIDWLKSSTSTIIKNAVNIISTTVFGTMSFIVSLFLALIFSIYLLSSKESVGKQSTRALYAFLRKDFADVVYVTAKRFYLVFSNFLGGQTIEGVIFGILVYIIMTIFKIPYNITVPLLLGFTTLIPYFGAIFGTIISGVLIATVDLKAGIYFLILLTILQQIEGNIIYPKVMGKSVGLPGLWVVVGVTVGGSIGGVLGMFAAVPIATLIYLTWLDVVDYRLFKKSSDTNLKLNEYMLKSYEKELSK